MTPRQPAHPNDHLVAANLGLVEDCANGWHEKTGQPFDEMYAVGCIGLVKGCRKYDPDKVNPKTGRPYALSTVAVPFINGEILHYFRDRGYTIKFPHRWREKWGMIKRLLKDPDITPSEVAERAGLRGGVAELTEMLNVMRATVNFDLLDNTCGCDGPTVEIAAIGPLQALIRDAWANLHHADQGLLCTWWECQRRHAYPTGPMQQFHQRVKSLLAGQTLRNYHRTPLGFDVEYITPAPKPRRQRRSRPELDQLVEQLGFAV